MLFVVTLERVLLRVKPARSRLIRKFVRTLGLLQFYLRQMPDTVPYDCVLSRPALRSDAFLQRQNPFARRHATAGVLEVPSELIGEGKINAWATISLFRHAPEVQVSRWGVSMVRHLFLNDPSDREVKKAIQYVGSF